MHYTIYKTTNLVNNKIYIGKHQTTDLDDGYLGSGKHLKRAIQKYGLENFKKEILFVFDNESDMNAKEAELVTSEFILREDTYNLCVGGQGGFSYINKHLDMQSTRHQNGKNLKKFILDKIEVNDEFKNEYIQKVTRNIIQYNSLGKKYFGESNSFYGKSHTDISKKKMADKNKINQQGNKNSQFGTIWITDGVLNKKIKKEIDTIPEGWYKGRVTNNERL